MCPIEDEMKRRKRTIVFNLLKESIKEVRRHFWEHVSFGDCASLVNWVVETYGIDRRVEREYKHFSKFKELAQSEEIKNFENWHAKVIAFLQEDKVLKMDTPPAFVRFQMQEATEAYASVELKEAWAEAETKMITERKTQKKIEFTINDLKEFIENVRTRYHSREAMTRKQVEKRINSFKNKRKNNEGNGHVNGVICVPYNTLTGCRRQGCTYKHEVIDNEEERQNLILKVFKDSRCVMCGYDNHKVNDCKNKQKTKERLKERKQEQKDKSVKKVEKVEEIVEEKQKEEEK